MANQDKLFVCPVKLTALEPEPSGELSDTVFRKCFFCEKTCQINPEQSPILQKLSGPDNFFCPFCLRHNLHNRDNRDILILSFRSIIGYLYLQNYVYTLDRNKMWVSEIEDYVSSHQLAGEVNPLFLYDSDTMLWFVDFSRVGQSKKKVPVDEVLKTVSSILTCFNFWRTIPNLNTASLFKKYSDAIKLFYDSRRRPENKKMLIPTLTGCGVTEPKSFSFDGTREFLWEDLSIKR